MWAYVTTFSTAKRGLQLSESEDAAWISPIGDRAGEISERSVRIAVADGASESLLAGRWARLLTSTFGSLPSAARSPSGFLRAYKIALSQWSSDLEQYVIDRELRGVPIQWFEEPGLAKGAFSTIVALEVFKESSESRIWRATALGDSCIFQVRGDQIQFSFPLRHYEDFSNRPSLLPSKPGIDDDVVLRHVTSHKADWQPGDTFYVATDALAAWFLKSTSEGHSPWESLRDLGTIDFGMEFEAWVEMQRDLGALHNDDTTLVRLDLY